MEALKGMGLGPHFRRRFKLDPLHSSAALGVLVAAGVLVAFYGLFDRSTPASMKHKHGSMATPGQGHALLRAQESAYTLGTPSELAGGTLTETDICSRGSCMQPTQSGHCPDQLFETYDKAYRPYWPGSVDLLVRTCMNAENYKVQLMMRSVDLFWPKGLGDQIMVLDAGEEWGTNIFPKPWKVFFEPNYLGLPGKVLQQWSYGWADNYTTSDFIAIMDDDAIFVLKITPALLFNLTTGKPYLISLMADGLNPKSWRQHALFNASTSHHIGQGNYIGNFMINLPWTIPRASVRRYREHVQRVHQGTSYDAVTVKWCQVATWWRGLNLRDHIAHNAMGNYIAIFEKDQVQLVVENSKDAIPIPRTGVHLSYIPELLNLTKLKKKDPVHYDAFSFQKGYLREAASRMTYVMCEVIPQGQLPNCNYEEQHRVLARSFWRYIEKWADWYRVFAQPHPNGTILLEIYRQELACMYNAVTQGCAMGGVAVARPSLDLCIRKDSSVNPGWWT